MNKTYKKSQTGITMAGKVQKVKKCSFLSKYKLNINSPKFFYFFCRIVPAAVMLALFLLPIGMESVSLGETESIPKIIYPYLLL